MDAGDMSKAKVTAKGSLSGAKQELVFRAVFLSSDQAKRHCGLEYRVLPDFTFLQATKISLISYLNYAFSQF